MRHFHNFPTAIGAESIVYNIVDTTADATLDVFSNADSRTQNTFVTIVRGGQASEFALFYDKNNNGIKTIATKPFYENSPIITYPLIDDIRSGLSSYNGTLGFELFLDDENFGYVNATGNTADTICLRDNNTIGAPVVTYISDVFYIRAQEWKNNNISPFSGKEYFKLTSSYSGNYEVCDTCTFEYNIINKSLIYSIKLANGDTTSIQLENLTNPVTIGGIVFAKKFSITSLGITSEMLATSNIFYRMTQGSAKSAPAEDGSVSNQEPIAPGTFDVNTERYYPNINYDGLGIDLITSATQLQIGINIYSDSFYNSVSSNDEVLVKQTLMGGKRIAQDYQVARTNTNRKEPPRGLMPYGRVKSTLMEVAKSGIKK